MTIELPPKKVTPYYLCCCATRTPYRSCPRPKWKVINWPMNTQVAVHFRNNATTTGVTRKKGTPVPSSLLRKLLSSVPHISHSPASAVGERVEPDEPPPPLAGAGHRRPPLDGESTLPSRSPVRRSRVGRARPIVVVATRLGPPCLR